MAGSLRAIRHVETAVSAARSPDGVVLRYGLLYGPGASDEMAAVGHGAPGLYNMTVVDDLIDDLKPLMFSIAYRMTGSVSDAKDMVAFDVLDGTVQAIRSVVNPDKLRHLGNTSQAWYAAAAGGWDAADGGWDVADQPAGELASVHGHRLHRRDRGRRRHRQLRRDTR